MSRQERSIHFRPTPALSHHRVAHEVTVKSCGILLMFFLASCGLAHPAGSTDHFALAARNGIMKIVVDKQSVVLADWRLDIVRVDLEKPKMSHQLSLNVDAYEMDPFSFDTTGSGVVVTNFYSSPSPTGPHTEYIADIPNTLLRPEPWAKQPEDTEGFSRYHAIVADGAFHMMTFEDQEGRVKPYVDLSTYPGGVALAFHYKSTLYVQEAVNGQKYPVKWTAPVAVSAFDLPAFVCFRSGEQYHLMTVTGQYFVLAKGEMLPVDADGRALEPPASAPEPPQPHAAHDEIAMVVDRRGDKPVAYRLIWHDGALHPLPNDDDTSHAQAAAVATVGINVLATSPSIGPLHDRELERRESEWRLQRQQEMLPIQDQ